MAATSVTAGPAFGRSRLPGHDRLWLPGDDSPAMTVVKKYFVYILASRPGGALYVGVTNNLIRRVHEHRNARVANHTAKYVINKLVHFEIFDSAHAAIQREKNIKHWPRAWKVRRIHGFNPEWKELYDTLF